METLNMIIFYTFFLAFGILMVPPQLFTHETTHPVCICAFYSFYVSVKEISMVDHSSTIIRFLIFAVTGLKQKSYLDPICRCTTYRMNCYAEGLVTMVTQRLLNKTEKVIRIALSLSWRKNTKRIRLPLLLSPHNAIKIFRKFALFWILFLALVIEYSSPLLWTIPVVLDPHSHIQNCSSVPCISLALSSSPPYSYLFDLPLISLISFTGYLSACWRCIF